MRSKRLLLLRGRSRVDPLAGFFAQLENADTDPVDIVAFGDSITMGRQSLPLGDWYGGWPTLLADELGDQFAPGVPVGPGWVPCRLVSDPLWTLANVSGLALSSLRLGLGMWSVLLRPGDSLTLPSTAVLAHDSRTVYYSRFDTFFDIPAGDVEVRVDDTLVATIPTRDVTLDPNVFVPHTGVHVGSPGTVAPHKIELTAVDGPVLVDGVFLHRGNQTSGIRMWNGGRGGDSYPALLDNTASMTALEVLQPALVIGAHFWGSRNVTMATFEAQLNTFIDEVRDRSPDSSIILGAAYESAVWMPSQLAYTAMVNTMRQVAAARGVAVVDPGAANALGSLGFDGVRDDPCDFLGSDDVHPTAAGFEAIGNVYINRLTNQSQVPECTQPPDPTPGILAVDWWAIGRAEDLSDVGDGEPAPEVWPDMSSNGRHLTQSNEALRPTYIEEEPSLNDQPAAVFTLDQFYRLGSLTLPLPFSGVVVDASTTTGNRRTLGTNSGGGGFGVGTNSTGTHRINQGTALDASGWSSGMLRIIEFYCDDGTNSWIRVNGVEVATGNAGTTALNQIVVGGNFSGSSLAAQMSGAVGLWAIYAGGSHRDDPNWADAEQELFDRYGVSLPS